MKRFLIKSALFLIILTMIDLASIGVFNIIRENAKGGSTKNDFYIAEQCQDEVIILGSSRAQHHYVPSVISDAFGYTCYNCGKDGMGIIYSYAQFAMLTERYNPKLIIYDISPSFDFFIDDYSKYIGPLKPYYYKKEVKEIVDDFTEGFDRALLISNMIRNNSRLLAYSTDLLIDRYNDQQGYLPLYGNYNKGNHDNLQIDQEILDLDERKIQFFRNMIIYCQENNIKLVFAVSPIYDGNKNDSEYDIIVELTREFNVPYFDYSDFYIICFQSGFFQDRTHLNHTGATIYTEAIVQQLIESGIVS